MLRYLRIIFQTLLLANIFIASQSMAATEVGFGSNITVDENVGNVSVQIKRTGDLNKTTTVLVAELWDDNRTTLEHNDISYNHAFNPNGTSYFSSSNSASVTFYNGDSNVTLIYNIANDTAEENTERLYFKIIGAGNDNIGDDSLYIKVYDDDEPPVVIPKLSIYEGGIVDEGDYSSSYALLDKVTSHDVNFDVSTYKGTYQEANYAGDGGDYRGLIDKAFTIRAGQTRVNIPVLTYQNSDTADALYESFELRIEAGSISSNKADLVTDRTPVVIKDVPLVVVVVLPQLSIYEGGVVNEGDSSATYARLDKVSDQDITFRVSTYKGTYQEANYLDLGGDYAGLVDKLFTIPAGSLRVDIPIMVYQNEDPADAEYESTEVCIETNSVSSADLVTSCTPMVILDVPVAVVNPPSSVSAIIFEDNIGSGWRDASWGMLIDLQAAEYDGVQGIAANFTQAWSGLMFESAGFDTTGYETLSFAISGSTANNGTAVYVGIYHTDDSYQFQLLTNYVATDTLAPDQWVVVHIPLSDLGATNALIDTVVFESGTIGVLHIDDLSFLIETGVCQ